MKQFIDIRYPPCISNKQESIKLAVSGFFGNNLRMWANLQELDDSDYTGQVVVRYYRPMSPYCKYNVPFEEVRETINRFVKQGADRQKFFFNEMGTVDCSDRLLQGEVMRSSRYLELFYSFSTKPMRQALQESGFHASGLKAQIILREGLEPSSFEDLQAIWDIWPDSVVEFTRFRSTIGAVKGRNSNFGREVVFWEVRGY